VLGTLSNQKRLDWISLATPSQTCTSLRSHRTVWCSGCRGGELAPLEKSRRSRGYNSSYCPLWTGLSGVIAAPMPMVGRTTSGRHVDFTNGRKVTPDCPVCHDDHGFNGRLRQKRKEITHYSLSGGGPDCPVHPQTEGNYGLPNRAPTAPSYLGAIKWTPRRME
jgi:hypothetical protein